jgi:1,4-dihydroxy-2-naphthoyl-CoA hydrolase
MVKQKYKTKVRRHQTDSAGMVFYANLFVLAHDSYESWLEQHISLSDVLQRNIHIPIVHAEADYHLPIRLSDQITIELTLAQKKQTSFTMQYVLKNADGDQTAQVQTVHVVIDSQTQKPIEIPSFLQDALALL